MTANQSPPTRPDGDARSAIFNILNEEITQPRPEYLPAHFNNAVTRLTALFAERATSPARDAAENAGPFFECPECSGDIAAEGHQPTCTGSWSAPPKPAPDAVREAAKHVVDSYISSERATPTAIENAIFALRDAIAAPVPPADGAPEPFAWVVLSDVTGNTRMWTRNGDVAKAFAAKHLLECVELYRSPSATEPPERELHGSSMPPDRGGAAVPVATPAARWRADGQSDPHGTLYDCERAALPGGNLTDDELANLVYLEPTINNLTLAKERIRWLSRKLSATPPVRGDRETEAAGAIIDVMMGGKFDWRSRIDENDFLESADWQQALRYAHAALGTPA